MSRSRPAITRPSRNTSIPCRTRTSPAPPAAKMSGAPAPLSTRADRGSAKIQVLAVAVLLAAVAFGWRWWRRDALVVYCAHDRFSRNPSCGISSSRAGCAWSCVTTPMRRNRSGWSNYWRAKRTRRAAMSFGTTRCLAPWTLADRGVLAPYRGPGWSAFRRAFKDDEGRWTGFAARLRVIVVNTAHLPADEAAVRTRLAGDLSRAAIAKPLYGTTLTHYSVLWAAPGPRWAHRVASRLARAAAAARRTGTQRSRTSSRKAPCDLGFADTDDFFEAKDDGKAVAAVPVRLADGTTICIPNTVALVQGARHEAAGRQLVDYLLLLRKRNSRSRGRSRGRSHSARWPRIKCPPRFASCGAGQRMARR